MSSDPIPTTVIRYEFDATMTLLMQRKMPSKIFPAIFFCVRNVHTKLVAKGHGTQVDNESILTELSWAIEHLLAIKHSIEGGK